jgi:hypothetical protein
VQWNNINRFVEEKAMKQIIILSLAILLAAGTTVLGQGKTSSLGKPVFPRLEYIDINAELGLHSDMLRGFGSRVDDARRSADAEAVAAQAVLLAFAEEIAGKEAKSVTSKQILAEAVRIAEEQMNHGAARVISAAAIRVPGGNEIASRLNESLALFTERRGEGNSVAFVKITNNCDRILDVYVDGKYAGFIDGGSTNVYSTGNGTTNARVTDAFGNTVNEVISIQPQDTYSWTITP